MKRRTRIHLPSLSHPAQTGASITLMALFTACVIMLGIERVKPELIQPFKSAGLEIATPVANLISAPKNTWTQFTASVHSFFNTYQENAQLKLANSELLKWQSAAKELRQENEELRALMRMVPDNNVSYVTTRMINEIGATSSFTALISAGKKHGIKNHQAVISPEGLIGRVAEVSENNARVLLLSDSNSHIPVIGEKGRQKAMLSGRGRGELMLRYVERGDQFSVGERLITSGDGGLLPPGILVGTITSVKDTDVSVRPLADANAASTVTVIDYKF